MTLTLPRPARALPTPTRPATAFPARRASSRRAAKVRYFGPRPLIEDNSASAPATTVVNGRVGYRWDNGWRVQLDGLNLFNAKSNQIEYFYESQLRGEAGPVADRHIHPIEPLAVRLTVAGPLP